MALEKVVKKYREEPLTKKTFEEVLSEWQQSGPEHARELSTLGELIRAYYQNTGMLPPVDSEASRSMLSPETIRSVFAAEKERRGALETPSFSGFPGPAEQFKGVGGATMLDRPGKPEMYFPSFPDVPTEDQVNPIVGLLAHELEHAGRHVRGIKQSDPFMHFGPGTTARGTPNQYLIEQMKSELPVSEQIKSKVYSKQLGGAELTPEEAKQLLYPDPEEKNFQQVVEKLRSYLKDKEP